MVFLCLVLTHPRNVSTILELGVYLDDIDKRESCWIRMTAMQYIMDLRIKIFSIDIRLGKMTFFLI